MQYVFSYLPYIHCTSILILLLLFVDPLLIIPFFYNRQSVDYGCGTGCVSQYFYNKYKCKVDAVEQSEIELTKAKISFQGGGKMDDYS